MLMFYIIELYYIVCFSMTNKSMRTFYVNKNSVCLSILYIINDTDSGIIVIPSGPIVI